MKRFLLGNTENLQRKVYFWNIMGSLVNALVQTFLLFAVSHISGQQQAGIFSLAYAISLNMLTIGFYEMRAYQATDVAGQFSFSDYFLSRILTSAAMIAAGFVFVWIGGYSGETAAVVVLLTVLKVFDALEDVFHGLYQQQGRLDVSGKSLALRVVFTIAAFVLGLLVTKNLVLTCWISIAAAAAGFCLFNLTIFRNFYQGKFKWDGKALKSLLWVCFPLFLGSFLLIFINSMPKYAIEAYILDKAYQAYFTYLFMPAFVINLFSTFIFKPMLTTMSEVWTAKRDNHLAKIIAKLLLAVALLTLAVEVAAFFLGIPVLSWFFGADLSAYRAELLLLVLGGGFNAVATLMFYGITVIRKQKYIAVGYAITLAISLVLCNLMVPRSGLMGASLAYLLSMVALSIIFAIIFAICVRREKRRAAQA